MCYHTKHTKRVPQTELRFEVFRENERFEIDDDDFYYNHANGYIHPELLIIPQEKPTVLHPAIWGIMPTKVKGIEQNAYYKKAVKFGGGLNAQSEKMFDHFIYKHSAMIRRCLVPMDGFYEPHTAPNKVKIPFLFKRKDEGQFAVAGIYNISIDGFVSVALLTKPASPLFANIHNSKKRQPVLLRPEFEKEWLRDGLSEKQLKSLINISYPEDELETYPVSRDLFHPNIDSDRLDITMRIDYPELGFFAP